MKKYLALGLAALLAIGATIVPDSYDKLFLRCNGTTTTFVDSSTANPKTITANGNATQLSIPTNWGTKKTAIFLNGSTDYVDIANSADFAPGVGAFEVELQFNTGIASTAQTIFDTRTATANTTGFLLNIINSTGNKLCFTTATTARITGTTTLATNTWYKAKIVGNGGADGSRTVILYLALADGEYAQEGSTYTNNYNFTDQTLRIGSIKASAGTYFSGWLKKIKYTKAATLVLDLEADSPATSPLAPAIAFDGTGDYLSLADSDDWVLGGGDGPFTFEFFARFNDASSRQRIWEQCPGANNYTALDYYNNTLLFLVAFGGVSQLNFSVPFTPVVGVSYHIAIVRNGSTAGDWFIFVNGFPLTKTLGGGAYNLTFLNISGSLLLSSAGGTSTFLNGCLREIRLSNVARYTTAFTPSQSGFTVDANTKLYIKGNENNGVTTFVDSETTPKTVTTNGDTKIKYTEDYRSCIFKDETGKFPYPVGSAKVDFFAIGSGVGYFDGAGDYLSTPNSSDFKFNGSSFSVEGYVRTNTIAAVRRAVLSCWHGASPYYGYRLELSTAALTWYVESSVKHASNITANAWYHVAVCGDGTNSSFFINGVLISTVADNPSDSIAELVIGTGNSGASEFYWNGLLDNIRISKGVARYTAAFNPPDDYSAPRIGKRKTNWFFFF